MTRTKKHLRNFIIFVTIVNKKVNPSLDVSKDKQTTIEKQTLNPENKTNNKQPKRQLKKCLKIFQEQTRFT